MSEHSEHIFTAHPVIAETWQQGDLFLQNAHGASTAALLHGLRNEQPGPLLVILPEPENCEDMLGDLRLFGSGGNAKLFPAWDLLPNETDHPDPDIAAERVAALRTLQEESSGARPNTTPPLLLCASIAALLQPTLPASWLAEGHLIVEPGQEIPPESVTARLVDAGCHPVAQVEGPGQFCRRGGILDVYPLLGDMPLRIEWFGDEIDTIRPFDLVTQRSGAAVNDAFTLVDVERDRFRKACERSERASLLDYLPSTTRVVLYHPSRLAYVGDLYHSGFDAKRNPLHPLDTTLARLAEYPRMAVAEVTAETWEESFGPALRNASEIDLHTQGLARLEGNLDHAIRELRILIERGTEVTIYCHNAAEKTRVQEVLLEKGHGIAQKITVAEGRISKGFVAGGESAWAVLGDHELFHRTLLRRPVKKQFIGAPIADFSELRPGDYVVHILNGIAKFEGLATLEQNGTEQDYLTLRFAEDKRIYVPLSHVDLVQRYVGSGARPTLSKLGSKVWKNRRAAAEKAARDIAADLLRVQAVRKARPGISLPENDRLEDEFDASFPYEETPDQLAAIHEIKNDQVRANPMDRLLCGDVGFGKTEVAVRAAFKVVNNGKQVAVLVPTTILAEQHARTFRERCADYPVNIECLSRFRDAGEQRAIVDGLKSGTVDIVIGTHRLLSKDVAFKDLGLVVIDEEQRFGVEHKERLKSFRAEVDVLTMTATPIPRTLNMALLGLRDISNLTTAPTDRHAIRTRVVRYNDELIRRAMLRELSRGGQVFFLHNRVQNIDEIAGRLSTLVPEARFGIGHGQMQEGQLLEVMTRFLNHEIDVLVCTSIIESGVDIPTVNTLFVNEADHFGLSALHQLRGRVGRYRYQAYAYFLVPRSRPVTPVAQKRLQALEEYAELGAGFRIAMRDLEIRGAGNILGSEQSGHIHQVGFDLYCRLLDKAVHEFRGESVEDLEPVELDLGTRAFVPTDYIDAEHLRVDFYRKLSAAVDAKRLQSLEGYARDRYGEVPEAVRQCFADQQLRNRAQQAGVSFLGRLEHALVLGFTESGRKHGVQRLRTMERKVTPMEGARWRIGLKPDESDTLETLLSVIDQVMLRLETPIREDEPAREKPKPASLGKIEIKSKSRAKPNDRPGRIEVGSGAGGIGAKARQRALDHVSETLDLSALGESNEPEIAAGARVIGIEPNETLGQLHALVAAGSFDLNAFGTVTLKTDAGGHYYLRYTGTARAPEGQTALVLRAGNSQEVRQITSAHLAAGGSEVLPGVVED